MDLLMDLDLTGDIDSILSNPESFTAFDEYADSDHQYFITTPEEAYQLGFGDFRKDMMDFSSTDITCEDIEVCGADFSNLDTPESYDKPFNIEGSNDTRDLFQRRTDYDSDIESGYNSDIDDSNDERNNMPFPQEHHRSKRKLSSEDNLLNAIKNSRLRLHSINSPSHRDSNHSEFGESLFIRV